MSGHGVAFVLAAAVWGSVAIALGIDAARRGRSGGVWGLTTFLLGPIGLGLYVLACSQRPPHGTASDDPD